MAITVNQLVLEFDEMSIERRKQAVEKLFNALLSDVEKHHDMLQEIIDICADYEDDDAFGTEGLQV